MDENCYTNIVLQIHLSTRYQFHLCLLTHPAILLVLVPMLVEVLVQFMHCEVLIMCCLLRVKQNIMSNMCLKTKWTCKECILINRIRHSVTEIAPQVCSDGPTPFWSLLQFFLFCSLSFLNSGLSQYFLNCSTLSGET